MKGWNKHLGGGTFDRCLGTTEEKIFSEDLSLWDEKCILNCTLHRLNRFEKQGLNRLNLYFCR